MEQTVSLWCHQCKMEFKCFQSEKYLCQKCKGDFCEQITEDNDPRQFVPFGELRNESFSQKNPNNANLLTQPQQQQQIQQQQQVQPQQQPQVQSQEQVQLQQQLSSTLSPSQQNQQQQQPQIQTQTRRRIHQGHGVVTTITNINISSNNVNMNLFNQLFGLYNQAGQNGTNNQNQPYDSALDNIISFLMQNDPNNYGAPPASKTSVQKLKQYKYKPSNSQSKVGQTENPENKKPMEEAKSSSSFNAMSNENVSQQQQQFCQEQQQQQQEKQKIEQQDHNKSETLFTECCVCKEEFILDDDIIEMPCQHIFHQACLSPWLSKHNSCPICRYELPTDDKDYENRKKQRQNRSQNFHQ